MFGYIYNNKQLSYYTACMINDGTSSITTPSLKSITAAKCHKSQADPALIFRAHCAGPLERRRPFV